MRDQGGIGFIILDSEGYVVLEYSRMYKNTTNNRMEIAACLIALESITIPSHITIITDSQYLIGCASKGWKRKKNKNLLKRLDEAMKFHKSISFKWTKGHSDDELNDRCDKLAVKASQLN